MTGPVLRDIHVPSAAWWPLAPGWWIVAVLVLMAGSLVVWALWRRSGRRVMRAALQEVDRMQDAFASNHDISELVASASRLLRRVALRIDPGAASASGAAWTRFLHNHVRDARSVAVLDVLGDAPFREHPHVDVPELLQALRQWCKHALREPHARRKRKSRSLRIGVAMVGARRMQMVKANQRQGG